MRQMIDPSGRRAVDRRKDYIFLWLMPIVKVRASKILCVFEQAQTELVGKAVILTDGKAGTVENVWLDEMHGL
jgi:hypothetical protein